MFSVSWIISVSLLLLSFFGIVFTAKLFAKPVDEHKVSFMRMFPFEMAKTAENYGKFYSFSTYLFSGICFTPIIVIVEGTSKLSNLNPLSIFIACLLGLTGLCFIFLNIFDVTHVKAHLTLFGIFASLTLLTSVLISFRGIIAYDLCLKHGSQELILLITGILSGVVALLCLLIMLNPKLKLWARLDQIDGEYVRPKRFPLAYSEWGLLLALFITEVLYFIQLLVK